MSLTHKNQYDFKDLKIIVWIYRRIYLKTNLITLVFYNTLVGKNELPKHDCFSELFLLLFTTSMIYQIYQSSKASTWRPFIKYVRKIFQKTNISSPLRRTYMCVCQLLTLSGVRTYVCVSVTDTIATQCKLVVFSWLTLKSLLVLPDSDSLTHFLRFDIIFCLVWHPDHFYRIS